TAFNLRPGPDRRLTTAPYGREKRSFRSRRNRRLLIVDRRNDLSNSLVTFPHLDGERALAGVGDEPRRIENFRNPVIEPQSTQARDGKDDGVELAFVELADAGVDVTPALKKPQV